MTERKQRPKTDRPEHHLDDDRRAFLNKLTLGLAGVSGVVVGAPVVGFVVGPMVMEAEHGWQDVGPVDRFVIGSTTLVEYEDSSPLPWAGVTARAAAWLRRESEDVFVAFTVHCTHLGCPVRYLSEARLFMCPCHGGVYYNDGSVAAGPPPASLPRYPVRVHEGMVQIMTSPLPAMTKV